MSQFSQIVAATFDRTSNEKNKATNQWSENALLKFLERKGALKRVTGGPQLEFTLDYQVNPDAAFLATPSAPTSTTKTEVLDAVKYDWALFVAPVNWEIADEAKNSGEKKVDLVTSIVDNALESHDDQFEEALFAATATNGMLSLPVILTEDGTGTIAGTNSAVDTFWANKFYDYVSDINLGMKILYNRCAKGTGGSSPNLFATSSDTHATYEDTLADNIRYKEGSKGDNGFKTLEFKGEDMIFSQKYSSDSVFFINTSRLKLYAIKNFWRQRRDAIEAINAATMNMKIVSLAQLAASDRSRNGVCFT